MNCDVKHCKIVLDLLESQPEVFRSIQRLDIVGSPLDPSVVYHIRARSGQIVLLPKLLTRLLNEVEPGQCIGAHTPRHRDIHDLVGSPAEIDKSLNELCFGMYQIS